PRRLAVLLHGGGEHSGRYEWVGTRLAENGISVWGMDLRGHGRSGGHPGRDRGLGSHVRDVGRLIEMARQTAPGLPLFLMGHSVGGLLALYRACAEPAGLAGLILSSPALRLKRPPSMLKVGIARLLNRFWPSAPIPSGIDPKVLSRDPEVVRAYRTDPLVHSLVPARWGLALLRGMAAAPPLARGLKVPCLILQAGEDRLCDGTAVREFAETAGPHLVRLIVFKGLYHEIFNEPEKERVLRTLIEWIETTAGRTGTAA
ncbi:MAG: hypothetical protein COV76_02235, partial [Candidatus Omnitrophica bacterium CG11_big_fil_rev_8_21_14_0_20_64_10]